MRSPRGVFRVFSPVSCVPTELGARVTQKAKFHGEKAKQRHVGWVGVMPHLSESNPCDIMHGPRCDIVSVMTKSRIFFTRAPMITHITPKSHKNP